MNPIDAQALEWQVVFWSGEVQEHEQLAFQSWLADDARHAQAWERIQQFGQQMQLAPQDVASRVLRAGLSAQAVQRRRALLRSVLLLACGGLGSYGISRTPQWAAWNADYRTASGQRKELTLPDGTLLVLNTASSLNVHYSDTQRSVVLLGGEVLISTASDLQDPGTGRLWCRLPKERFRRWAPVFWCVIGLPWRGFRYRFMRGLWSCDPDKGGQL